MLANTCDQGVTMEPKAVSILKLTGDPDQLLAWKKETIDPIMRSKASKYGAISQTVVKTADGLMMINFWSTEEGRLAMGDDVLADPDFIRATQARGERQVPEAYEVVQHLTPESG
ncbi:MAG: hypothetical protein H0U30_07070 [Actinobacteria bacterium]|nr:hypothetical protein [Actinomycetota bacterium]